MAYRYYESNAQGEKIRLIKGMNYTNKESYLKKMHLWNVSNSKKVISNELNLYIYDVFNGGKKAYLLREIKTKSVRKMRTIPTEAQEQEKVVMHFRTFYKDVLMFAVANERKASYQAGAQFKKTGVLAGVPDLQILTNNKHYKGLFIEMKAKDGRLSDIQKYMIDRLSNDGYKAVVCYGADEAISIITEYMGDR